MIEVKLLPIFVALLTYTISELDVVRGSVWSTSQQEALDEQRDAEILFAVQNSMRIWRLKKQLKSRSNYRLKRSEPKQVCYKNLDCFEDSGPFRYLEMLPNTPTEIGTRFILYASMSDARKARTLLPLHFNIGYENISDAWDWATTHFNSSQPTKVIVHGFGSSCLNYWVYEMRTALATIENPNIVCIEWANGAQIPNYVRAVANTRLVGTQLGQLLRGLNEHANISYDNVHLIGFSLGAHVAGLAGSYLNGSIYRITGLDPAGPLFETHDSKVRLDSTDAKFVDVIHSNGENLILGGLGAWEPMGDVDFYPNGGRIQKGCANLFVGAVSDIIWSSSREGKSLCNHRRAYKFFTESVLPHCQFPAFSCTSHNDFLMGKCFPCTDDKPCANMGFYADRSLARGQLYLVTREIEPFCAHQYRLTIKSSPGKNDEVTFGKIDVTVSTDSDAKESFTVTQRDDEELKSNQILSKIFVPHPIVNKPSKIEILYTTYNGWISSGLPKWLIDKVSIENSEGKSLSFCKRSIKLESKVPVLIPLFNGNCHYENETFATTESSNADDNGSADMIAEVSKQRIINELLNLPERWNPAFMNDVIDYSDETNRLDVINRSVEQSRALNVRRKPTFMVNSLGLNISTTEKVIEEIVEPILKPKSDKKRSHRSDTIINEGEIAEPILLSVPHLSKNTTLGPEFFFKNQPSDTLDNNKEQEIFYTDAIFKTENITSKETAKQNSHADKNDFISITIQILPEKLTKVFEKVENYTRKVILPLISANTPKFINDLFSPDHNKSRSRYEIKYVPTTIRRLHRTLFQRKLNTNTTLLNNSTNSNDTNTNVEKEKRDSRQPNYSVGGVIKYIPLIRVANHTDKLDNVVSRK